MSNLLFASLGLTALRLSQAVGPHAGSGRAFLLQQSITPHCTGIEPREVVPRVVREDNYGGLH